MPKKPARSAMSDAKQESEATHLTPGEAREEQREIAICEATIGPDTYMTQTTRRRVTKELKGLSTNTAAQLLNGLVNRTLAAWEQDRAEIERLRGLLGEVIDSFVCMNPQEADPPVMETCGDCDRCIGGRKDLCTEAYPILSEPCGECEVCRARAALGRLGYYEEESNA